MSVKRDERLAEILLLLDQHERIEVDHLAEQFAVSPETIRRDLSTLSERGLLRKIHGGAVKFQTAQANAFTLRSHSAQPEKNLIARYATQFIDAGDSLFINAGTTTVIFARHLARVVEGVTVISNSALVANELWNQGVRRNFVYLLGGYFNGEDVETVGAMVIEQLERFRTDQAFLTVSAISGKQGFMDHRVETAAVTRRMVEQAQQVTVLADSGKFDLTALVTSCNFSDVHRLVTDDLPSQAVMEALEEAEVELHIAQE